MRTYKRAAKLPLKGSQRQRLIKHPNQTTAAAQRGKITALNDLTAAEKCLIFALRRLDKYPQAIESLTALVNSVINERK